MQGVRPPRFPIDRRLEQLLGSNFGVLQRATIQGPLRESEIG
jgi:hypothetical protein